MEKVTEVLKVIADDLWVSWAARLIPNVAHQVREEAEARVHKERKQNTGREVGSLGSRKCIAILFTEGLCNINGSFKHAELNLSYWYSMERPLKIFVELSECVGNHL